MEIWTTRLTTAITERLQKVLGRSSLCTRSCRTLNPCGEIRSFGKTAITHVVLSLLNLCLLTVFSSGVLWVECGLQDNRTYLKINVLSFFHLWLACTCIWASVFCKTKFWCWVTVNSSWWDIPAGSPIDGHQCYPLFLSFWMIYPILVIPPFYNSAHSFCIVFFGRGGKGCLVPLNSSTAKDKCIEGGVGHTKNSCKLVQNEPWNNP